MPECIQHASQVNVKEDDTSVQLILEFPKGPERKAAWQTNIWLSREHGYLAKMVQMRSTAIGNQGYTKEYRVDHFHEREPGIFFLLKQSSESKDGAIRSVVTRTEFSEIDLHPSFGDVEPVEPVMNSSNSRTKLA